MSRPIPSRPQVALIGVSGYAKTYLRLALELQALGKIKLCAAVVIDPERQKSALDLLQQHDVTVFADYQSMLARHHGALDLCLIPTGIAWHKEMTLAALAAGTNVLVEKPLAGSLSDAQAIRDAEKASDRFVAVGFQNLYTDEIHRLKTRLNAGLIGSLTSVRMLGLWSRDTAYYTRNNWAGRLFADGVAVHDSPLNNAFAHFAMLSLFLSGSTPHSAARLIGCTVELFRAHAIESFDTAVVQAELEGGLPLWIGVSHACTTEHDPEIVIEGTRGQINWRHEDNCRLTLADGSQQILPMPKNDDARLFMLNRVVARLHDPGVFICGPELSEHHAELVHQIHTDSTIRDFSAAHVLHQDAGPVVPGLANALHDSFAHQTSLAASPHFPAATALVPE